ncbi:FAD-dependent oxidoreductase [Primorskyibacter sp. 2E233]
MPKTSPVIILGAGLAGCAAAMELAQSGHAVT